MKSMELKRIVREKYGRIAMQTEPGCGCHSDCCGGGEREYTHMNEDYSETAGYVIDADLGLGVRLADTICRHQTGRYGY